MVLLSFDDGPTGGPAVLDVFEVRRCCSMYCSGTQSVLLRRRDIFLKKFYCI